MGRTIDSMDSGRFLIYVIAAVNAFPRSNAWRGFTFDNDPQLVNKSMVGDEVVTYSDVTPVTCAARCAYKYPCGGFAYNAEERVCKFCALCGNLTLVEASGYKMYVVTEDPVESSYDQANICSSTSHMCWVNLKRATSYHASVGPAGTWIAKHGLIQQNLYYFLRYIPGTYEDPLILSNTIKDVSYDTLQMDVGTDIVWRVKLDNKLQYRPNISAVLPYGGKWIIHGKGFKWVSVSPGGSLWAINTEEEVLHYLNMSWPVKTGENMKCIDAGQAGVWALNTTGQLFYRLGTSGDSGHTGTEWRALEGTFQSVSSGRDLVVAVDMAGRIWLRTGVGPDTPTGLAWRRYPGYMKQVEVYQTEKGFALWATDTSMFYSALLVK